MFQFHIGSIQRESLKTLAVLDAPSFNSTLVRFKVSVFEVALDIDNEFQFHIGSIQSETPNGRTCHTGGVSIPHWFDSKRRAAWSHLRRDEVSIPHWFDSKKASVIFLMQLHSVSIPHWFDSKFTEDRLLVLAKKGFQFHIGSIQRPPVEIFI